MSIRNACLLSVIMMVPLAAQAADLRAPAAAAPQRCVETSEINPDIFGFSTGSDVAEPGSLALGLEYGGAFGARSGTFVGSEGKVQLSYGLVPCVEIGPSIVFGYEDWHARGGWAYGDASAFGAAIEAKFKLLTRAQNGIGLTLVFEPGWVRVRDKSYERVLYGRGYGSAFEADRASFSEFGLASKIALDAVVIPDRLFLAVNLIHEAAWPDVSPSEDSSTFAVSAALTAKLSDAFYLGVEGSYRQAYASAWFDDDQGDAVFLGPTFLWEITENVALSGAWSIQVAGDEPYYGLASTDLNLVDFNHHEAKLKLGISF